MQTAETAQDERTKVESWRLHVLIEAGYPLPLAERLAHVGDAGAQRLEKRLSQAGSALERQRAEAIAAFEQRLNSTEHELRRRVDSFTADMEAERAVLEARLHELSRRLDEAMSRA